MAKFEEGELELVLGNKQILSAFFIVVILFGVFFTMGFIVGKNSGVEAAGGASDGELTASGRNQDRMPGAISAPGEKPSPADQRMSEPALDPIEDAPTPSGSSGALPGEEPAPRESREPSTPAAGLAPASAPPGAYVQVAAIRRQDAQAAADSIRSANLPAHIVRVKPGQDLFRVIVGPVNSQEEYNQTRNKLIDLGWKSSFRMKHP